MELWDIYDENRVRTGRTIVRGQTWGDEKYHLVIHVAIFDSNGRLLIQRRLKDKKPWPDMWDVSCAGSAVAGEDSRMAAMRELKEELGLDIDLTGVRPHFSMNYERGFDDFYAIIKDVDIKDLKLQKEEVQDAKWATLEEVRELYDNGQFVQYFFPIIELLWQVRDNFDGATKSARRLESMK